MTEPRPTVVCDAGPLIHLDELGCIDLLADFSRVSAKTLGLRVHGTLGILVRSIRRGQRGREEVLEMLRSLPGKSTLFIRQGLMDEVVRDVENASGS